MEVNTTQQVMNEEESLRPAQIPEGLRDYASPEDGLARAAMQASTELHLIRGPQTPSPDELKPLSRDAKTIERIGQLLTRRGYSRNADKRLAALNKRRPLRVTPDL